MYLNNHELDYLKPLLGLGQIALDNENQEQEFFDPEFHLPEVEIDTDYSDLIVNFPTTKKKEESFSNKKDDLPF
ncbi:MAG: hypothetical protein PF542_05410 [Nanoarchaeota archaeon]|jgi:hypothetical protein|nr:hypothetical protein [Nanoarchaeota archaeon]